MPLPLTLVAAAYRPLAFLGGFWAGLAGVSAVGPGDGEAESGIPAVVAPMVSPDRRASALRPVHRGLRQGLGLGSVLFGVSQ